MKIYTTSFLLLFFIQPLMAQLDSTEKNFIYSLIRQQKPTGIIYYSDNSWDEVLKRSMAGLSKRLIVNRRKDSIWLSKRERRYLLKQLKTTITTRFADSLFPDSKVIAADSIFKLIHRKDRQVYDSLLASQGIEVAAKYLRSRSRFIAIRFTRPVYIRNRSIMLFHFVWQNALADGETYLSFFRKENGQWEKWITVDGGAW